MIDSHQPQKRILPDGRVAVNRKRNHGIVFGLDQKGGDSNTLQELVGRLRAVIVIGAAEAENTRGIEVVEFVNGPDLGQVFERKQVGRQRMALANAVFQSGDETVLIKNVLG